MLTKQTPPPEGLASQSGSQGEEKTLIIIYGPPASGKTINAEVLRKHYRCAHVFDAGFHDKEIIKAKERVLVLSCEKHPKGPKGHRRMFQDAVVVPVSEAAFAVGEAWIPANIDKTDKPIIADAESVLAKGDVPFLPED